MPTPSPVRRAGLLDRLQLRLSEGRVIDGLWIGTSESQPEAILHRVEQALLLIKTHDPHRYDRLRRDLVRVWVRLLPGDRGSFNAELRACELDPRFVLRPSVTPAEVAATITHEAAHARLENCRIRYSEDRRHRIGACAAGKRLRLPTVCQMELPSGSAPRNGYARHRSSGATPRWRNSSSREASKPSGILGCLAGCCLSSEPLERLCSRFDGDCERPNQRLKLAARGGRLVGNGSVLSAAAAGRSLSAIR